MIDPLVELKNNIDPIYSNIEIDKDLYYSIKGIHIKDDGYFSFISECNGGFAYSNTLHIYGIVHLPEFHNISFMNFVLAQAFKDMGMNIYFFAEDVFGNQFGFSNEKVCFFNIE